MIISKLTGGMGNQLFQYAVGRMLSHKWNTPLYLDISFYKTHPYRTYDLEKLNIKGSPITSQDLDDFKKYKSPFDFIKDQFSSLESKKFYKEKRYTYNPEVNRLKNNTWVSGYWQSEKYFKNIREELIHEIKPSISLSQSYHEWVKQMEASNSVSIHIRRGDYVSDPITAKKLGALDMGYYKNAIEYIERVVKDPYYFVISDDVKWCKSYFKDTPNTTVIENSEVIEDFFLMSKCKHNITANSTFSWWASWINTNQDKIVVSPRTWFKIKKRSTADLIPQNWEQL